MDFYLWKTVVLICGIAAGCLFVYLGAKLYERGVLEKGSVDVEGHGVKLKFKDYGPGVVFATIGGLLVIFCVTQSFSDVTSSSTTAKRTFSEPEHVSQTAAQNLASRLTVSAQPHQPPRVERNVPARRIPDRDSSIQADQGGDRSRDVTTIETQTITTHTRHARHYRRPHGQG
jgi:hypothetical protein